MTASPSLVLRHVALVTRDLSRLLPFYRDTLGFTTRQPDAHTLTLHFSPAAPAVITFTENPAALTPQTPVAGLFHLALLVPDRAALAAALGRLVARHQPIEGLSDHGVSEAIYLADPDGNGLEIYRDRPRAQWPTSGEQVAMVTVPLDGRALLREQPTPPPAAPLAQATLGHLHLQVTALDAAKNFYVRELGMTVRQDSYTGAVFMAADGYHHHLAVNTWSHPAQRPAGPLTGLTGFTVALQRTSSVKSLDDPDGIRVTLEPLGA